MDALHGRGCAERLGNATACLNEGTACEAQKSDRTEACEGYGGNRSSATTELLFQHAVERKPKEHRRKEPIAARIKHIAIYTQDPDKEADFYCRAFDLKQVKKSPSGAIYLSDGYINVALLKPRGAVKLGLHHFGFEVENVKQAQERLRRIKPDIEFLEPHPGVAFAEYKASDPDGNPFDISEKGWEV